MRNYLCLILLLLAAFSSVCTLYGEIKTEDDLCPMLGGSRKECEEAIDYITRNRPPAIILRLVDEILKRDDDPEEQEPFLRALKIYPPAEVLQAWIDVMNGTRRWELKEEIVGIVGEVESRDLVIPLAQLLRAPVDSLRAKAIQNLIRVGDDRMYPFILRLAESSEVVHRLYALEALSYLYDKRFLTVLTGLLKDENKSVRIYTLNCLYRNNLREALPSIRDIALGDLNQETRIRAIEIIGDFCDDKSLYVLLKTLTDPDRNIRLATVRSLYKIRQASTASSLAIQLFEETDREIRDGILDVLAVLRKGGDLRGLQKVLYSDGEENLRVKAAFVLGIIREERAIPILAGGLGDSSMRVRAEICGSLSMYRGRFVTETLMQTVKKDGDVYVRTAALYGLLGMKEKKMMIPLFDIFAEEKDPLFREILRMYLRRYLDQYL